MLSVVFEPAIPAIDRAQTNDFRRSQDRQSLNHYYRFVRICNWSRYI